MKVDRKKYRDDVVKLLNKKLNSNNHSVYSDKTLKKNSDCIFFIMDKVYEGKYMTPLDIITCCPMDLLIMLEAYTSPHTRITYCKAIRWYISEHEKSDVYKAVDEVYKQCMIDVDGIDTNCPTDRIKECSETISDLQEKFLSKLDAELACEYMMDGTGLRGCGHLWPISGYYVFVPAPRNDFYITLYANNATHEDILKHADEKHNIYDMENSMMYYGDSKTLNFKRNRDGVVKCIPVKLDMHPRYKELLDQWTKDAIRRDRNQMFGRIFPGTKEECTTRYIKTMFGSKYNIQILRKKWATQSLSSGSVSIVKYNANAMLHGIGLHIGYYATEEKKEEEKKDDN